MRQATAAAEAALRATCFGGEVSVHVGGAKGPRLAAQALRELGEADRRLTRFDRDSELCRLNRDPREQIPASPLMVGLAAAIAEAGRMTEGLVDGTLIDEVEDAGYVRSMSPEKETSLPDPSEAPAAPARQIARGRWRTVRADPEGDLVLRPLGVRIDSGGLGKGLAADHVGAALADAPTFCVNCSGDMLVGGTAGLPRTIVIEHPLRREPAWEFDLRAGGVATSGVTKRAWRSPEGEPRHHLIDPRTGRPADTGILQVTALAQTALEAEWLAKAALLSGPDLSPGWLPDGGVIVFEDGSVENVPVSSLAGTAV